MTNIVTDDNSNEQEGRRIPRATRIAFEGGVPGAPPLESTGLPVAKEPEISNLALEETVARGAAPQATPINYTFPDPPAFLSEVRPDPIQFQSAVEQVQGLDEIYPINSVASSLARTDNRGINDESLYTEFADANHAVERQWTRRAESAYQMSVAPGAGVPLIGVTRSINSGQPFQVPAEESVRNFWRRTSGVDFNPVGELEPTAPPTLFDRAIGGIQDLAVAGLGPVAGVLDSLFVGRGNRGQEVADGRRLVTRAADVAGQRIRNRVEEVGVRQFLTENSVFGARGRALGNSIANTLAPTRVFGNVTGVGIENGQVVYGIREQPQLFTGSAVPPQPEFRDSFISDLGEQSPEFRNLVRQLEPTVNAAGEAAFNPFAGYYGDYGSAGSLSAALWLLNMPEGLITGTLYDIADTTRYLTADTRIGRWLGNNINPLYNVRPPDENLNRLDILSPIFGRDTGFTNRWSEDRYLSIVGNPGLRWLPSGWQWATGFVLDSAVGGFTDFTIVDPVWDGLRLARRTVPNLARSAANETTEGLAASVGRAIRIGEQEPVGAIGLANDALFDNIGRTDNLAAATIVPPEISETLRNFGIDSDIAPLRAGDMSIVPSRPRVTYQDPLEFIPANDLVRDANNVPLGMATRSSLEEARRVNILDVEGVRVRDDLSISRVPEEVNDALAYFGVNNPRRAVVEVDGVTLGTATRNSLAEARRLSLSDVPSDAIRDRVIGIEDLVRAIKASPSPRANEAIAEFAQEYRALISALPLPDTRRVPLEASVRLVELENTAAQLRRMNPASSPQLRNSLAAITAEQVSIMRSVDPDVYREFVSNSLETRVRLNPTTSYLHNNGRLIEYESEANFDLLFPPINFEVIQPKIVPTPPGVQLALRSSPFNVSYLDLSYARRSDTSIAGLANLWGYPHTQVTTSTSALARLSNSTRLDALRLDNSSLFPRYGVPLPDALSAPANRIVTRRTEDFTESFIPDVRPNSRLLGSDVSGEKAARTRINTLERRLARAGRRLQESRAAGDAVQMDRDFARVTNLRAQIEHTLADYPELGMARAIEALPDSIRPLTPEALPLAQEFVAAQREFFQESLTLRQMRADLSVVEQQLRGQQQQLALMPRIERLNPIAELATARNYGMSDAVSPLEHVAPTTAVRMPGLREIVNQQQAPVTLSRLREVPELQEVPEPVLEQAIRNEPGLDLVDDVVVEEEELFSIIDVMGQFPVGVQRASSELPGTVSGSRGSLTRLVEYLNRGESNPVVEFYRLSQPLETERVWRYLDFLKENSALIEYDPNFTTFLDSVRAKLETDPQYEAKLLTHFGIGDASETLPIYEALTGSATDDLTESTRVVTDYLTQLNRNAEADALLQDQFNRASSAPSEWSTPTPPVLEVVYAMERFPRQNLPNVAFGPSVELSLTDLDTKEYNIDFSVGGSYSRSGANYGGALPRRQIAAMSRWLDDLFRSTDDDIKFVVGAIGGNSYEETYMKYRHYYKRGFRSPAKDGDFLSLLEFSNMRSDEIFPLELDRTKLPDRARPPELPELPESGWFHGTRSTEIRSSINEFSPSNELGPGLYVTNNRELAFRYARATPPIDRISLSGMVNETTNTGRVFPVTLPQEFQIIDVNDPENIPILRSSFADGLPEVIRTRFMAWSRPSRQRPFREWFPYLRTQYLREGYSQTSFADKSSTVIETIKIRFGGNKRALRDGDTINIFDRPAVGFPQEDTAFSGTIAESLLERYRVDLEAHSRLNSKTTRAILQQDLVDIETYHRNALANATSEQEKIAIDLAIRNTDIEIELEQAVARERAQIERVRIEEMEQSSSRRASTDIRQMNEDYPCL